MIRALSILELALSSVLLVLAAVLNTDPWFRWFEDASCGMVLPTFGFYPAVVAFPVGVAGILHWSRRPVAGFIALAPAAAVVVFLAGQILLWW